MLTFLQMTMVFSSHIFDHQFLCVLYITNNNKYCWYDSYQLFGGENKWLFILLSLVILGGATTHTYTYMWAIFLRSVKAPLNFYFLYHFKADSRKMHFTIQKISPFRRLGLPEKANFQTIGRDVPEINYVYKRNELNV